MYMLDRRRRMQLGANAVHLPLGNAGRTDERILRQLEIAALVIGRNRAFIHPEQVHSIPFEFGSHHVLEQQLWS